MKHVEDYLARCGLLPVDPDLGDHYYTTEDGEVQRFVSFQSINRKGYQQFHSIIALHVASFERIWRNIQPEFYLNHPVFGLLSSNMGKEYFPLSFTTFDDTEIEGYIQRITSSLKRFPSSLEVLRDDIADERVGAFRLSQFDTTNQKTRSFLRWLNEEP